MEISFKTSLIVILLGLLVSTNASAQKGYNDAFKSCSSAIDERFADQGEIDVKRVSFRKAGRVYKVKYSVRVTGDEQKHDVRCTTDSKGVLKNLEVKTQ